MKKHQEENEQKVKERDGVSEASMTQCTQKRRNRWDQAQDQENATKKAKTSSDWDAPDATPGISRWDAMPTPRRVTNDATAGISRRNRWDETPTPGRLVDVDTTPIGGITPSTTPAV